MRHWKVLISFSTLLILFILWALIAPSQKVHLILEEKELPISREALSSHIESQGWEVTDSAEGSGGGLFHTISDEGMSYLVVGSYADGKKRSVTIQVYPGREIAQEDEQYIISLLFELYGVRQYNRLMEEIDSYQSKKSIEYADGALHLVEDGIVIQAAFTPSETKERQKLTQISIFNSEGAEYVSASARDIVVLQLEKFGVELRKIEELKDLSDEPLEDNSEYEIIEVKGHLSNIKNAQQTDMPSFSIPYKDSEPFVSDYEKADLVVGGEKIQVLIKQRVIEKEELEKERTHYLFRKIENNELVVFASVRLNG